MKRFLCTTIPFVLAMMLCNNIAFADDTLNDQLGEETIDQADDSMYFYVQNSEITLEEGQNYKIKVSLDKERFYEESLVFTLENDQVAQISRDGTVTAVSAGKTAIIITAKLKNPNNPTDNVRSVYVSLEVKHESTLSAEQLSALEELKSRGESVVGEFKRQEMIIRGIIASDAPRITYNELTNIINTSSDYEEIFRKIEECQEYPDYIGGSGITRIEYWLDDKGNEKIRLYPTNRKNKIYLVRCSDNGTVISSEALFPEKSNESTDEKVKDNIYVVYNNINPELSPIIELGDIDSSGFIDITDLTELSLSLLGDIEFTDGQKSVADIDGDGSVTLADLARLQQYLSKKINSLR